MHAPLQQRQQPLQPFGNLSPTLAPPVPLATAGGGGAAQDAAQAKKGGKAKDLSHVPCKFFKANSCTAGKACPFSHDLTAPGTNKPVCQWFAKGNCKFGHKCALAHVLPGQPLSFDRKNKRAAQQALREAQANGQDGGFVTATNVTAQAPLSVDGHGLVRTLRQSVDYVRAGEYPGGGFVLGMGAASSSGASHNGSGDAMFGSPDSLGHRTPASSPPMQHRTVPHSGDAPHSPLSFATLSQGPTATFIAPAASGLSYHLGSTSNGRTSLPAHAMLSEQARRLSSTSGGEPLSPPRVAHLSRARMSFHGASPATDLPSSPPLAVPVALPASSANGAGGGGAGGIFGTSPFSGSRGLFIPSSYDSNEDAFPRSPPARSAGLPHDMARANSQGTHEGWTIQGLAAAEEAIVDDDDDFADEAFLPSSLNDLLTPEEMRRRTLRAFSHGLHGPSSLSKDPSLLSAAASTLSNSPNNLNSKSVPADLLLSHGQPPLPPSLALASGAPPSLGPRSSSATAAIPGWGTLSSSVEGHNPSAMPYEPPTRSLLSQSRAAASVTSTTSTTASPILSSSASTLDGVIEQWPTYASSLLSATLSNGGGHGANGRPGLNPLGPGVYSASFNDAAAVQHHHALPSTSAFSINPPSHQAQPQQPRYPQSGLSPNTNASLAAPGSSLPGGLAAGLSRLHLVPPTHTGETPPSSSSGSLLASYAAAAASPPARTGPAPGSALARRMSSNAAAGAGAREVVGSPLKRQMLVAAALQPPMLGRTTTSGSEGVMSSGASALGEEDDEDEGREAEEIQFDMEVA
ncbi:hypothetical protein JCM11251_003742 [Rhodosporidiobolus azoricus]